MPPVGLDVAPDVAHVRVVRLVAVALARLLEVDEDLVEDIRLVVGEACTRAVAAHLQHGLDEPIHISFDRLDGGPGLAATVTDAVGLPEARGDAAMDLLADGYEGQPSGMGLDGASAVMALLAGLAEEVDVHTGAGGTRVDLRWRTGR